MEAQATALPAGLWVCSCNADIEVLPSTHPITSFCPHYLPRWPVKSCKIQSQINQKILKLSKHISLSLLPANLQSWE
jgi:hypothetical protein